LRLRRLHRLRRGWLIHLLLRRACAGSWASPRHRALTRSRSLTSVRTAARPRAGSESLIESLLAESLAALPRPGLRKLARAAAASGSILESASIPEAIGEPVNHDAIAHDRTSQCRLVGAGATAFGLAATIADGARRSLTRPLTLQLGPSLLDFLLHALARLLLAAETIDPGRGLHGRSGRLGGERRGLIARTLHWWSRRRISCNRILRWHWLRRPALTLWRLLIAVRGAARQRRGLCDIDDRSRWRRRGQQQH